MADTIYSFVDESGDPVLFGRKRGSGSIVGNPGYSHYFIMGKLEVDDPVGLSQKLNALREDLLADPYFAGVESFKTERTKTALGFHANNDLPEVRYQVFRLLREQGQALRFHAVVADKKVLAEKEIARRKTDPKARYNENSLYDGLVRELYSKFHRMADAYHVWLAKRGKSDRNEALRMAIEHAENDFEYKFGFRRGEWQINVSNLETTTCLQAVDYFFWAVQRFYEPRTHTQSGKFVREDRYLNMLWPQIGEIQAYYERSSENQQSIADIPVCFTGFSHRPV
jgi:hypothetical protein